MTKLSVNINKVATLRNARGGNVPCVNKVALDCEKMGADGITIHPRPDQRHITRADALSLGQQIKTELNIEGYPTPEFIQLVKKIHPRQVTLVPDAPDAITSSAGWDTKTNQAFLTEVIEELKADSIRTSIFTGTEIEAIEYAAKCGTDRVELYTEPYAAQFETNKEAAVAPFVAASTYAHQLGLGVNAGHDLNLQNLNYFFTSLPYLDEVSIGHALISDALYLGLAETIKEYKAQLKK